MFGASNRKFSVKEVSPMQANKFNSGFNLIPHVAKKAKGGEDAALVLD